LQWNTTFCNELYTWYQNHPLSYNWVFFETQRIRGFIVVDEVSSSPGLAGVYPVPIAATHIDICRPAYRDSPIAKAVKLRIKDFVDAVAGEDERGASGRKSALSNLPVASAPFVTPDGWVYFQGTDNKLWKVKNDGTGQLQVGNNTTKSTPFVTPDGWVWFQGIDDKLWKVFNDGTQQSQPGDNTTFSSPTVVGGWVYFRGTDNKLWRMKTDGSAQVNVGGNTIASTPFATADSIYFQGADHSLWRYFMG
jgi:hypothetical protein